MLKCGCDPHVEWCHECRQVKVDQANRDRGWVKCADQMPPDDAVKNGHYITWDGFTVRENNRYRDDLMRKFRWAWSSPEPTHWMPLPPCPKGTP